jgi:hypothetical protein
MILRQIRLAAIRATIFDVSRSAHRAGRSALVPGVVFVEDWIAMKLKDPLLRLLAVNCVLGLFLGALFAFGLIALDSGRLRTLMLGDHSGHVALFVLLFSFMSMGASMMMGTAIMSARADDNRKDGGGTRAPSTEAVRVRVPSRAPVRL